MKLPGIFHDNITRAFTNVELLIVLGIGVMMAAAVAPIYSNLVPQSDSTQVASEIVQTLRIARERSIARMNDSSYGVKFDPTLKQYILYQGPSYATRIATERTATLGSAFSLATTFGDDINFSKETGVPNIGSTVNITVSHVSAPTKTILINTLGFIETQ